MSPEPNHECAEERENFVRKLVLIAMLPLAGCDVPSLSACEQALRTGIEKPDSYRRIKVQELFLEGKASETYIITYSYSINKIEYKKNAQCSYWIDNGEVLLRDLSSDDLSNLAPYL